MPDAEYNNLTVTNLARFLGSITWRGVGAELAGDGLYITAGEVGGWTIGDTTLTSAGSKIILDSGNDKFDCTTLDIDCSAGLDIDVTSSNIDIRTVTSGTITIASAANNTITISSSGTADIQLLNQDGANDYSIVLADDTQAALTAISDASTYSQVLSYRNGNLTLNAVGGAGLVDVNAIAVDVDASGAIALDAAATSNFTASAGNLSLIASAGDLIGTGDAVTITADTTDVALVATRDVIVNCVDMDINASDDLFLEGTNQIQMDTVLLDINVGNGGVDIDSGTSGFALDTSGPITLTCTGNNHIQLITNNAYDVVLDAGDDVILRADGTIFLDTKVGGSGADIDIDAYTAITMDANTDISIFPDGDLFLGDAGTDSIVVISSGVMTIDVTHFDIDATSGDVDLSATDDIFLRATNEIYWSGHFLPLSGNAYDIGDATAYVNDIYCDDLLEKSVCDFDVYDDMALIKSIKPKERDGKAIKDKWGHQRLDFAHLPDVFVAREELAAHISKQCDTMVTVKDLHDIREGKKDPIVCGELTIDYDYIRERTFRRTGKFVDLAFGALKELDVRLEALENG